MSKIKAVAVPGGPNHFVLNEAGQKAVAAARAKGVTRIAAGEPKDRPVHPKYGQALSGQPYVVDGVIFRPYSCGVLQYVRVSDDGRIKIFDGKTRLAMVDENPLAQRFLKFETAARAAIKATKKA